MMFLTDDEIVELTGKLRHNAQAKVLRAMGIEHRLRPDGSLVVSRSHVEQMLGGKPDKVKEITPDWRPGFTLGNPLGPPRSGLRPLSSSISDTAGM